MNPPQQSTLKEFDQTDASGIPTGNTYDKYGASNPIARRLMAGFERSLRELFDLAQPRSILDIGCGEGVLTQRWARQIEGRVLGLDLDDPKLQAEWSSRKEANLEFRVARGERIPAEDNEFDIATAIEVLEHVEDPDQTLAEMARSAQRYLLISVPREPLWRMINVARGTYLKQLGNTPGHVNHWSKRAFIDFASQQGEVVQVRSPLPWTMLLVQLRK